MRTVFFRGIEVVEPGTIRFIDGARLPLFFSDNAAHAFRLPAQSKDEKTRPISLPSFLNISQLPSWLMVTHAESPQSATQLARVLDPLQFQQNCSLCVLQRARTPSALPNYPGHSLTKDKLVNNA